MADGEPASRDQLQLQLRAAGHEFVAWPEGVSGRQSGAENCACAIIRLNLREPDGLTLLAGLLEFQPRLPVIVVAGAGQARESLAALRQGAYDVLAEPFAPAELLAALDAALDAAPALGSGPSNPPPREAAPAGWERELPGTSPAMVRLREQIRVVAARNLPVLLTGEPGVGKRRVARLIHTAGPRREWPLVALEAPALTLATAAGGAATLWEEAWAAARGGSLVLSGVGELSHPWQVWLARELADRLGGASGDAAAPRLVATAAEDLASRVEQRRFAAELYYRLGVHTLAVPALRDRREDIPLLAEQLLAEAADGKGVRPPRLGSSVQDLLSAYGWPGNVRELQNAMVHALAFCAGRTVYPEHLPAGLTNPRLAVASGIPGVNVEPQLAGWTLAEVEQICVRQTLERCEDSKTAAARMLGVAEKTVYNHLARWAAEAEAAPAPGGPAAGDGAE